MMPITDNNQPEAVDYKQKYKTIKKKLKLLLYEHECFLEELRKSQRKLLKVSRDKSFLLDRLMQYENIEDSSSDSDMTASSDSEVEGCKDMSTIKKKKSGAQFAGLAGMYKENVALMEAMGYASSSTAVQPAPQASKSQEPAKKKAKITKKPKPASGQQKTSPEKHSAIASVLVGNRQQPASGVTMTREELERHLEMKQSTKPQYMSIGQAMNTLPDDIFGNEDSNQGPINNFELVGLIKEEDDSDLIIDTPID